MSAPRPITLITGASAGIGWQLARVFAAHDHELVLVARREERLNALAEEIAAAGKPRPTVLPADLERHDAAQTIGEALAARDLAPQYIVNNAGFGLTGPVHELDRGEQLGMIDLNVRVLTDFSLTFIDSLERHSGGLLNVASVAAFLPGPGMAVYYASKAYVLSFSEALHRELEPRGIRVCVLCPGPVPTEFQTRAGLGPGATNNVLSQPATKVAALGYRGLMQGRRRVVVGFGNKLATTLIPFVPRRLLLDAVNARQSRRNARRLAARS